MEGQVGGNLTQRQVIDSLLKGASKQRVKERQEIGQDGTTQERKGRLVCVQIGHEDKQKEIQKRNKKKTWRNGIREGKNERKKDEIQNKEMFKMG